MMKRLRLVALTVFMISRAAAAQGDLLEVQEDFSHDPGWDWSCNRVEASDPPLVKQAFGWSPGKVGGTIWKSTTPAWYGMPLNPPLSFNDPFTVSGKLAVVLRPHDALNGPVEDAGAGTKEAAYLGFFNHERQGWRPWSSMAMRIVSDGPEARVYIDSMSGNWGASGIAETELAFPADGSQHTFKFIYDPNGKRVEWTDTRLHSYLTNQRQTIDQILAKAKQVEPDLSADALERRLDAARSLGLISYLPRHGQRFFLLKKDQAELKGAISVQIDDRPPFYTFLTSDVRQQPVALDRFGIFNMQLYHGAIEFYASDLTINGKKIDLNQDPKWDGKNNHLEYAERDFERQNFGYSPDTNFAGGKKGELGGEVYNVEPNDPLHGYYADDVGRLTLDDPIHFGGKVCFIEGSTDAGLFFGFFNADDEKKALPAAIPGKGSMGWPQANTLGIVVDGPAHVGWYFIANCTAAQRELFLSKDGPVFLPTRQPHNFDFKYDPQANGGVGRITVMLDKNSFTADLKPEQRKAGATFDRFGLMSFRRGGKFEILYLDDLTYTARRPKDFQPVHHEQQVVTVPYPPNGRKY